MHTSDCIMLLNFCALLYPLGMVVTLEIGTLTSESERKQNEWGHSVLLNDLEVFEFFFLLFTQCFLNHRLLIFLPEFFVPGLVLLKLGYLFQSVYKNYLDHVHEYFIYDATAKRSKRKCDLF